MALPDSPARRVMHRYIKWAAIVLGALLVPLLVFYVRVADAMVFVFWFSLVGVAVLGFVLLALYLLVVDRAGGGHA